MATDPLADIQRRLGGFAADMRAKGIHMGINGACPTCGQQWPCESSNQADPEFPEKTDE